MKEKRTFPATKLIEFAKVTYYTFRKYVDEGLFKEKDRYTLDDLETLNQLIESTKYGIADISRESGISEYLIKKYLNMGVFLPTTTINTEKGIKKYYSEDKIEEIKKVHQEQLDKQRQAYKERSYYISPEDRNLGKRLQTIREALGFPMEYVEEQTDISQYTIYAYEQGRAKPNTKVMELYKSYGVNEDWILNNKGTRFIKRQ